MGLVKRIARATLPRSIRGWLRTPIDSLRWTIADVSALLGRTVKLEIRPGWIIRSHPGAYHFAYQAQQNDPEQEAEFNQFISLCTSGMILFDIGAHFGLFSLSAINFGGPNARAIAVDPSPLAARIIQFQANANNISKQIIVRQSAMGEITGTHEMVPAGIGSAGYFVLPSIDHPTSEQVRVNTISIDELASKLNVLPSHIKIDVEGFELSVLKGGENTFSKPDSPLLFLELHLEIIRNNGGNPLDCINMLRRWGMLIYNVHGNIIEDAEILKYSLIRLFASKNKK